ncbi:MAG: hypothetical protein JOY70_11245 [Acidisphaera sp.]|nr:hypothetical protein [Acidisphaera sp.]MBV9811212.1 hypothetical protein [Acetobacteraceae bacterium]
MVRRSVFGPILLALAMSAPAVAAPPTPDNFDLRTTADLVAVCSATPTDLASAADAGFCHGYMVGVYRVLEEVQAARPSARMFCPTGGMPNRTDAIAAFVAWVGGRPDELAKVPQESVADYFAATYPCPATAATGRGRARSGPTATGATR